MSKESNLLGYPERINNLLKPRKGGPIVVDLFAGCGGLSLGFEATGFTVVGYEADKTCCRTYQRNLNGPCHHLYLTDDTPLCPATILVGGPPCQPFSVIGLQKGVSDVRNGLPLFINAVQTLNPDIWIFENVRGLMYRSKWYLDKVVAELRSLGYIVELQLLNAVNFGVPQNRERLIVVGHRGRFSYPEKNVYTVTVAEAIGDTIETTPPESKFLTQSMDNYIARYEAKSCCINPRDLRLHQPARTLTCRNLAGATSDMQRVRLPDGRRRRLLVAEAKRLQSFPDWFEFHGTEQEQFNQIGNAVAPFFAYQLASSVADYINSSLRYNTDEIAELNQVLQQGVLSYE